MNIKLTSIEEFKKLAEWEDSVFNLGFFIHKNKYYRTDMQSGRAHEYASYEEWKDAADCALKTYTECKKK